MLSRGNPPFTVPQTHWMWHGSILAALGQVPRLSSCPDKQRETAKQPSASSRAWHSLRVAQRIPRDNHRERQNEIHCLYAVLGSQNYTGCKNPNGERHRSVITYIPSPVPVTCSFQSEKEHLENVKQLCENTRLPTGGCRFKLHLDFSADDNLFLSQVLKSPPH